jgi:hypothetical protein
MPSLAADQTAPSPAPGKRIAGQPMSLLPRITEPDDHDAPSGFPAAALPAWAVLCLARVAGAALQLLRPVQHAAMAVRHDA